MKVGILTPVHNHEYLVEFYNSIKKQEYKEDIDLNLYLIQSADSLLDGSFLNIVLEEKDFNINLITIDHKVSIGAKRNVGLVQMIKDKIDLVIVIDSDDTVEPLYVQNMIEAYQSSNADVVFSNYRRSDGVEVNIKIPDSINNQIIFNHLSPFIIANPKVLMGVGGYSTLDIAEDWELWFRLMKYDTKFDITNAGYNYRVHSQSATFKRIGLENKTRTYLTFTSTFYD